MNHQCGRGLNRLTGHRRQELLLHCSGYRIELFRTVQGDYGNGSFATNEHQFGHHPILPVLVDVWLGREPTDHLVKFLTGNNSLCITRRSARVANSLHRGERP